MAKRLNSPVSLQLKLSEVGTIG